MRHSIRSDRGGL